MTTMPIINKNYIYLDSNSCNQILPEVKNMIIDFIDHPLNPSSIHYLGQQANGFIEDTRDCLKQYLNLKNDYGVIFTSCGSEANNLAVNGVKSINNNDFTIFSYDEEELVPDELNNSINYHSLSDTESNTVTFLNTNKVMNKVNDEKNYMARNDVYPLHEINISNNNFDLYICTASEHKSILQTIKAKKKFIIAPITKNGILNLERLIKIIEENKSKKIFLSLIYINNETGAINNLVEIVKQIRSFHNNIVIHSDMGQAVGKLRDLNDLDFQKLDVDLATIIGYKFGAMIGAGALIYKKNLIITPMILGGSQEYSLRAGTENVLAIYSIKVALDALYENKEVLKDDKMNNCGSQVMGVEMKKLNNIKSNYSISDSSSVQQFKNLRDYFELQLKQIIHPSHLIIFSENTNRIWNTSYFAITSLEAKTQLMFFNSNKIYIGTGSACSAGLDEDSHVLFAMGFNEKIRKCAIRVSLNTFSTKDSLDILLEKLQQLYYKFKEKLI
jgi:cysteine desulfurase